MQEYQLILPGQYDSLALVSEFIGRITQEVGFTEDDTFHIQMAVDEACSNVIEHAYAGECHGTITIKCHLVTKPGAESQFVITLQDTGQPFDPCTVPNPPLGANLEDLPEGGLGLYFMRKLMDDVRFEFHPDHGNTLTMVKILK